MSVLMFRAIEAKNVSCWEHRARGGKLVDTGLWDSQTNSYSGSVGSKQRKLRNQVQSFWSEPDWALFRIEKWMRSRNISRLSMRTEGLVDWRKKEFMKGEAVLYCYSLTPTRKGRASESGTSYSSSRSKACFAVFIRSLSSGRLANW